jgi:hypothetical protein
MLPGTFEFWPTLAWQWYMRYGRLQVQINELTETQHLQGLSQRGRLAAAT